MTHEHRFIASEIKQIEDILSDLPEEDVIERMSFESRLESARAALAALPQHSFPKARLTFRGKPVVGSHGIAADFGSKAAYAFADAFAAVAAGLNQGLRSMGPIPNRDKNQLLITGTVIGSFGFEFELPATESTLFQDDGNTQEAMVKIESLLRFSAQGTDDEVAEVITDIHPRAVKKVHEFLDLLVQNQAWCGLDFGEHSFRFTNYEQLKAAGERLKDENIRECNETFFGEFQGVLPAARTFEFKPAEPTGLIRGKFDVSIEDPDVLNRQWLHKQLKVTFNVTQVGQAQPRFTLMSLDDLELV
jgi:hypothetical protein